MYVLPAVESRLHLQAVAGKIGTLLFLLASVYESWWQQRKSSCEAASVLPDSQSIFAYFFSVFPSLQFCFLEILLLFFKFPTCFLHYRPSPAASQLNNTIYYALVDVARVSAVKTQWDITKQCEVIVKILDLI